MVKFPIKLTNLVLQGKTFHTASRAINPYLTYKISEKVKTALQIPVGGFFIFIKLTDLVFWTNLNFKCYDDV